MRGRMNPHSNAPPPPDDGEDMRSIMIILCAGWALTAPAREGGSWEQHMAAAASLVEKGCYDQAEEAMLAAWREAERFKPDDPRTAVTLHNLGYLNQCMGRYAEAENYYKRGLLTWEKSGVYQLPPAVSMDE